MKATVEISKYPLNENYEPPILDFIGRIKANSNIVVKTNATSTHITGNYDEVMKILQNEIKISFKKYGKVVFVMKILNGDLGI